MSNDRPRIKVPLETLDIIIELINVTLLILLIVYTIMNYLELPETIATHFNAKGEADGYGNRLTICFLPSSSKAISTILTAPSTILCLAATIAVAC